MPATPNVARMILAVRAEFEPRTDAGEFGDARLIGIGVCNCRKKRGSSSWSHHAWCNAGDIRISRRTIATPDERRLGDAINDYLAANRDQLAIYRILWWQRSTFTGNTITGHRDHLHAVPWPYGIGTPPCAGGVLEVRHRDGSIGNTFGILEPPGADIGDEAMQTKELTALLQSSLIDAGYDLGDFEGLTVENPDGTVTQYPDGADGIIRLRAGVSYPALVAGLVPDNIDADEFVTDQELAAHADNADAHHA